MKRTSLPLQRRAFIALLGGAAAWPLGGTGAAGGDAGDRLRAQHVARRLHPVRGRVPPGSEGSRLRRRPERRGRIPLGEGQVDRLPALAADLVRRPVDVIARQRRLRRWPPRRRPRRSPSSSRAAATRSSRASSPASTGRAATSPARSSLPARSERNDWSCCGSSCPGDDHRGARASRQPMRPKRERRDVQAAAQTIGQPLVILERQRAIATSRPPLRACANASVGALLVGADPFFASRRERIVALAARHALPAMLLLARVCRGRRPDELRHQHHRRVSPGRHLHRAHSQGREARRPAGHAVRQVRAGAQPQDRQGARPRHPRPRCSRSPTR